MKYIITESQFNTLVESMPSFIKRRMGEMDDLIKDHENNIHRCDNFSDGEEYANTVIAGALGKFMMDNIEELSKIGDYVYDWDKLIHQKHHDRLVKIFNDNCPEYTD